MGTLKKAAFSALAVLLFFGGAELLLRLFYRPHRAFRFNAPHSLSIVQRDSELGYRLRPGITGMAYGSYVQTNSRGFRGPEFDAGASVRIVALGDSCTFGFGASDNDH